MMKHKKLMENSFNWTIEEMSIISDLIEESNKKVQKGFGKVVTDALNRAKREQKEKHIAEELLFEFMLIPWFMFRKRKKLRKKFSNQYKEWIIE